MDKFLVKTKWGDGFYANPAQPQPIRKSEHLFLLWGVEDMKWEDVSQYFEQYGKIKNLNLSEGMLLLDQWEEGFATKTHQIAGKLWPM